jgi:carboxyl-terminal processing protease
MVSKKTSWGVVTIILLALVVGFVVGNYFAPQALGRRFFLSSGNKINVILDIVEEDYVDSVNMKEMVEDVIPKLIGELDPHSAYIPADKFQGANEELEGHYGGIGAGYVIQDDTIMVVNVVPGGPSEQAGVEAGDRLITVDGLAYTAGQSVSPDSIIATLRGPVGTKIKFEIKKRLSDTVIEYEIVRGEIPDNTVLTSYEVSKGIGLIKIRKFARTTYDEFIQAMAKLSAAGCSSFILDLRSNTGGILDIAVNMANDFLSKGRMIVYTEGRAFERSEAVANGAGSFQENQLVVLMDEISASASEVVAGAIQDNDRGLIIGRRSYGKGLVQKPIKLSDGSALRLTIARYYTPSGRCIQRNYVLGKSGEYEQEWIDRFYHGEAFSQDSIKFNESLKYYTSVGRVVYGGGGIMPDIFVPRDTSGVTSYYMNLENHNIFYRYAFKYVDQRREMLKRYKDYKSLYNYLLKEPVVNEIVGFANSQGIKPRLHLINISYNIIQNQAIAYIIGNVLGNEWLFPVVMKQDPVVLKAIETLKKGDATPEAILTKAQEQQIN